jgi:hypothetical protein
MVVVGLSAFPKIVAEDMRTNPGGSGLLKMLNVEHVVVRYVKAVGGGIDEPATTCIIT